MQTTRSGRVVGDENRIDSTVRARDRSEGRDRSQRRTRRDRADDHRRYGNTAVMVVRTPTPRFATERAENLQPSKTNQRKTRFRPAITPLD